MTWRAQIESHYRQVWGLAGVVLQFRRGPVHELPSDFSVLRFPPHGDRGMWTYATCCMSQPDDKRPIELHMFSRSETDQITELLVVTAHYHHTGARLDLNHSVNFGRPWLDNSLCQHGFISLPYLDGPSLENLQIGSSIIKFYWLIPVTRSEIEYKQKHGVEALEQQFDREGFDYINPQRASIV